MKRKKIFLWFLFLLNMIVLLGQLWPEGAPPFSRTVNVIFLLTSIGWIIYCLRNPTR